MNTADMNEQQTAMDGHVIVRKPLYEIVVTSGMLPRYKSEPLPLEVATERMAKTIKFHMAIGGYKQDAGGDVVTLRKGSIKLEIQLVEVAA